MRKQNRTLTVVLGLFSAAVSLAQNDGDHCITSTTGQTYLAPDAQVLIGGLPVPPVNMTIGTTASGFATLRSRGDQLPVFDQFVGTSLCTFRTDVPMGNNQNWSMVRCRSDVYGIRTLPTRSTCKPCNPMGIFGCATPMLMGCGSTSRIMRPH